MLANEELVIPRDPALLGDSCLYGRSNRPTIPFLNPFTWPLRRYAIITPIGQLLARYKDNTKLKRSHIDINLVAANRRL